MGIGVAWIIVVIIGIMVPLVSQQSSKAERTTAKTVGTVIAYNPAVHATATYEYWVSGTRFEGSQAGMSDYPIGSSVPIFYDPNNPSLNYAMRVPPSFTHNLFGICVLVVISFCAVLLAAFGGRRAFMKNIHSKPPPLAL